MTTLRSASTRPALLALALLLGACAEGEGDPKKEEGTPYCEHKSWNEYDQPDGKTCAKDRDCNSCREGSVCLGPASGDYLKGSTHHYLGAGFTVCSPPCTSDADCTGKSAATANGWTATETWTCASVTEGKYCAVKVKAPDTSSCGEPCPKGCCSTTGLSCCQPPFCSGACAGSPCC